MADSAFSLNSVLGWLKGFLNQMACPVSGFGLGDAKVKEDGDIFSSLFTFEGDTNSGIFNTNGEVLSNIEGETIDLNVLLKVLNFKEVFKPVMSALNELNADNVGPNSEVLALLLGSQRGAKDGQPDNEYHKGSKSLLGINLVEGGKIVEANYKYTFGTFFGKEWSWKKIAEDFLKYGLECKAPGAQYGAIDNQPLSKCGSLISEYLEMTGIIMNVNEVQVDIMTLVAPLLVRMQAYLIDYYESAYEKYVTNGQAHSTEEASFEDLEAEPARSDATTMEDAYESAGFDSAKTIDVTLQKITGTSEIKMTAIKANYSPSEVLDDMEELMEQDEFIDSITEEPQTFTIGVDDDGFDIERCDSCQECDPCDSLGEALKTAIQAYRNLYIIHWMSSGNDMMKTHLLAEEMYDELIQEIDTLGELMVEKCGTIIDPNFPCEYIEVKNFEFQESLDVIKSLIQPYIDAIDFAYCNQDSDVQSTFDEWLRYWKKQLNYFVTRQEA